VRRTNLDSIGRRLGLSVLFLYQLEEVTEQELLMAAAVISTPLTALLGIRHPILLAPMGDSAGGRLAAAVSGAGGFGLIGGGYANPAWLAMELAEAGDARVGVGFITFALAERPEALHLALEAGAPAIQLSFGDPRPFADVIHGSGALLICQVQSFEEVTLAISAGADVIVAQGQDAGGHGRPDRGTIGLVPSVVDRVAPLPVVAAGGLAEGRGLAAALMLGAAGVTMGTRFLASTESISNPAEAAGLVAGRSDDTVRTSVFDVIRGPVWPAGYDGRAVRNDLIDRWDDHLDEDAARRRELEAAYRASAVDDYSMRPLWAGEGLDLITGIEPAASIVWDVVNEAAHRITASQQLLIKPTGLQGGGASEWSGESRSSTTEPS
jgi:nitronate monooxygenase